MVPCYLLSQITVTSLLFLVSFLTFTQSQITPITPSPATMAECGPRLIVLAPCAPFVEGQTPGPTEQCCDNLIQVYDQQRSCLCLFLNGTALASLPINTTLALQLPGLCSPQIDPSTCSPSGGSAPPISPASPDSFRNSPSAAAAAGAPTINVAPRPSTVRFGLGKSSAYKLAGCQIWGVAVAAIFLLLENLA
ncbi:non-specific lipid transfer protein GPI-anchored 10 [Beta vulgaris subsp. vulgaris]|uniref:non-specific lipid transfer protein GPI-anchored 10 n=1 Tax=Beta vulgaris subsp. vulgaris TaxID=3555 RepID=UPI002549373D|nr:non-specific lipid transfer protein GPI-anchored 10 [Beta vulgaris subsp. vulgaris]